jgi:hypothetical protein
LNSESRGETAKIIKLSRFSYILSRPEGAVGIIWVYISIIVRNDSALRAGKKLYIYLCGLCVARDISLKQILGIKDIGEDLDTFRQRLHPHSCQWILRKPSFRDWTEEAHEDSPYIYWLTGPPAAGKTLLSSFIIHYLRRGFAPGTCQYHFFQAAHHGTRTTSYFLRSLAFQIAQRHEEFRLALTSTYQNFGMPFESQKYRVIWDKLFEGILFRLKFDEPFFWVLDGLDEAESPGVL